MRPKDIDIYDLDGAMWVRAGTGGISTSASAGPLRGAWWRLEAGYDHSALLVVWNDYDDHWSWEPAEDMTLSAFQAALRLSHPHFVKL